MDTAIVDANSLDAPVGAIPDEDVGNAVAVAAANAAAVAANAAAVAAADATGATRKKILKQCADIVRKDYPRSPKL